MKKLMFALVFVMLFSGLLAQAPQGITHQAVIRNTQGELLTNQLIGIQVSIIQGEPGPDETIVYQETHLPQSNAHGLITYVIGKGTNVSGIFENIDWAAGPYFLKNEVDPAGGTNYTITGTTQFLSVPYALHAGNFTTRPPKAIALEATEITPFSATINGIVNGEGFLTEVVFDWGETTEYGNTITAIQSPVAGSMDVEISAALDELTPGTQYHFRVRASNAVNVTNSNNIEFSALATTPQISTNSITEITLVSAVSGGNISYDGGDYIIARGIVWNTAENPTLEENDGYTTDGEGIGEFTSQLTGLLAGTNYFVRAYATNSAGTAYGAQISFETLSFLCGTSTVVDGDGNEYSTVLIDSQCWIGENLRTSKYSNGTPIDFPANNNDWENNTDGAYSIFPHIQIEGLNSDEEVLNAYGALYNWHAVNNSNGLCPLGWRVPENNDFTVLLNHLGGESVAGGKLKSTRTSPADPHPSWLDPNTGATNESNWSGLPGGYRAGIGPFYDIGVIGNWWSTTEASGSGKITIRLEYKGEGVILEPLLDNYGASVRCIEGQPDQCMLVPSVGCCDNNVLVWCVEGELFYFDCGDDDCGWNATLGFFDCGGMDPVPDGILLECPWTVPCIPDCNDLECGPDPLCGQPCGTCEEGYVCIGGQCVEVIPELTCSNPGVITCGQVITGNTTGAYNVFVEYPSCLPNANATGGEHVYVFTVSEETVVTVNLTDLSVDLDLFILEGNCDNSLCINYSATTGDEQVSFTALPNIPYFIVVDGYAGAEGSYSLSLSCNDGQEPDPEFCEAVGAVGCCDGAIVRWCEDGEVFELDCSQNGTPGVDGFCGWDNWVESFWCGGSDPVPDGIQLVCPNKEP